ncbi:MAG: hypothetical protein IJJ64_15275 [Butyrivibrio sp.]|nr:hypothetical protein [Butyrivibrio sp.]
MEKQRIKYLESRDNGNNIFYVQQSSFSQIPGMPIAYWCSKVLLEAFDKVPKLSVDYEVRNGITTGDNNLFLRLWYEVSNRLKWLPCNKGGSYRKWAGNRDYVVDWKDDGFNLKNYKDKNGKLKATLRGIDHNFCAGITMSRITSGEPSFRYMYDDTISESATNAIYPKGNDLIDIYSVLGLLNSKVGAYILNIMNPTINVVPDDLRNIPLKGSDDSIIKMVKDNIAISETDWDSFETSWDFKKHPLI